MTHPVQCHERIRINSLFVREVRGQMMRRDAPALHLLDVLEGAERGQYREGRPLIYPRAPVLILFRDVDGLAAYEAIAGNRWTSAISSSRISRWGCWPPFAAAIASDWWYFVPHL